MSSALSLTCSHVLISPTCCGWISPSSSPHYMRGKPQLFSATISSVSFPLHSSAASIYWLRGSFILNVLCKPEWGCSQRQGCGPEGHSIFSLLSMASGAGRLQGSLVRGDIQKAVLCPLSHTNAGTVRSSDGDVCALMGDCQASSD